MAIWICQCLCENRHCMVGVAFDDTDMSPRKAEQETRRYFKSLTPKQVECRCCGSRVFHYESARSKFSSIAEARPHLEFTQAMNVITGDILEHRRKHAH